MKFLFGSEQPFRDLVLAVVVMAVQWLTGPSVSLAGGMHGLSGLSQKSRVQVQGAANNFGTELVVPRESGLDNVAPLMRLHFSAPPTSVEISSARVFEEPLVPQGATSAQENLALAEALSQFSNLKTRAGLSRLEAFVKDYSSSAWTGSVQADLGLWYRQNGYFSRAVTAWEASWAALKASRDPIIHALADRVAGELTELLSSLGRTERLQPLLQELQDRPIYGSATQQIQSAHEKLWLMYNKPGDSFKCGPYALDQIRIFQNPSEAHAPAIVQAQSGSQGFSLEQVEAMATMLKMNYQMARRSPGAAIVTPAVVHWKSGHYAALLKEDRGTYLVKDPTFGRNVNFTLDALEDETDGYFLVPNGTLPAGWHRVSADEAKAVRGRGSTDQNDPNSTKQNDLQNPPGEDHCPGMMTVSVFLMTLSLSLQDTPLIYTPPLGPEISFQVIVNQLEANQPAIFSYSNLGPLAVHNWMAFVTAPSTVGQTAYVNLRGGGRETYALYKAAVTAPNYVGSYAPDPQSNATLWVTSSGTYQRHLPDGSNEIYATPDGSGRIFLNQVVDPQGNAVTLTYDKTFRLISLKDAIGQVTTLSYSLSADPRKITKVTDPFGRFASFGYTTTAPYLLTSVTDEIGITSQITYGSGNQFASLVTPYGTTKFGQNLTNEQDLTVQVTDPEGQSEYYERRFDGVGVADSEPAIPSGYGLDIANTWLEWRDTYYWSKNTVAQYGTPTANSLGNGYYNVARLWHWLHTQDNLNSCSGILESEKKPLESRVWYNYLNQAAPNIAGPNANPIVTARLLDDGTTQADQYSYNSIGQVTKSADPVGRTFTNTYASNGIDLIQTQGANNALLTTDLE